MRSRIARTLAIALSVAIVSPAVAAAQTANPRIGKWKLKQDAPPPAVNIMTYEPYGDGGMKVTVDSTNRDGRKATWTYVTMFDGKDEKVTGDTRTETTAVKKVDERTNEITNKRGGKVTQVIINVLSPDGKRIDNTYKNYNEAGELTSTTTAVYEKIQ
jgi:hypothetical protein